jgi:uncharacterized protein (DUF952 family)
MESLFHIVGRSDWAAAVATAEYRAPSLQSEGFIHCSFAGQVARVANALYRDVDDLCVVEIDPARLDAPVRVEDSYGSGEEFPHVYGPVPAAAAVAVHDLPRGPEGDYRFSDPGPAGRASPDR